MKVEFDEIYNEWIVWLVKGNSMLEVFKSKSKKDCLAFIKKEKKRGKKNK